MARFYNPTHNFKAVYQIIYISTVACKRYVYLMGCTKSKWLIKRSMVTYRTVTGSET